VACRRHAPVPVSITAYPSLRPAGNTVPTSIGVDGLELVLFFANDPGRPDLFAG
jgi:hypothetical protein